MSSPPRPQILAANPAIGERGDLHIYRPDDGAAAVPFVLGIHGGGWRNGDQSSFDYLWDKLRPLGMGLVLASYRLAPEHPFPAAYEDLLNVLAWLKTEGAGHGLDTSRCLLFGSSAGGHLAMLLATRAIAEDRPRPTLCGVAEYCGIMDLSAQYAWDEERGAKMTRDFLATTPSENPSSYRDASPLAHVHPNMPPVWMAHGSTDTVVSIAQSRAIVERLQATNQDVIFLEGRNLGHTMIEIQASGEPVEPRELFFEQDLLRFTHRCFQPPQSDLHQ